MKHALILLSSLVLAQSLPVEESDPFGKDAEQLLVPLLKEFDELKHLVNEVKQFQKTQKISAVAVAERIDDTPFIEAWDPDACNKLTETVEEAVHLADVITSWVFNTGLTLSKQIFNLVHCWQQKPDLALKCVVDDITEIKNTIDSNKPVVNQYKNQIVSLANLLRAELKKCLGTQKYV